MHVSNQMIRGLAFGGQVRLFGAVTTGIVEELRTRHDLFPVTAAALGRTATAALMMGAMLKGNEQLTVRVEAGGPIGKIVVDADATGKASGYVTEPHVELPLNARGKLDVAGAVGTAGFLTVIKDLGMKEPYVGSSPIVSGEIAEDFTYYFATSEQTPSVVALGVLVDTDYSIRAAGGFIVQLMPGLSEEDIVSIETKLQTLPSMTTLLDSGEELADIFERFLKDVHIYETKDVFFGCRCSREKVESSLISIGATDLRMLIEEDEGAELVCHFCNETYRFTSDDLRGLLETIGT